MGQLEDSILGNNNRQQHMFKNKCGQFSKEARQKRHYDSSYFFFFLVFLLLLALALPFAAVEAGLAGLGSAFGLDSGAFPFVSG